MLGGPTALSNRIDQSGPWYLVAFQMEIKPKPEGLGDLGCRLNCYPASQLARRQPAIKASTSPSHQSGQSVICAVLDSVDSRKVQRPDTEISLVWIPGHMDIQGNEKADEMAKEAAKSKGTTEIHFPSTI
jgi:hypothetical protein